MYIWIPLVAVAITAGVSIFLFFLSGRRERDKSRRDAIAKYRSAFAAEVTQIDNQDAHSLMSKAKIKHDVAIHEFRPFVDSKKLQSFDAAVRKFDQCRSEVTPAALAVMASLATGSPIDDSDTIELKKALNELLEFAEKS